MTELEELSTSFSRLRPREDPDHRASVERARAAKQQVERRLLPIMSRWQRPHDDEATRAVALVPKPEDIKSYLAFQRVVDIAATAGGLRHRLTVEYWKSAPYLMSFMRGYKVKSAVDDAWKQDDLRRTMVRGFGDREESLCRCGISSSTDGAGPAPPLSSARRPRARASSGSSVGTAELPPYAPGGRFKKAADSHATKILVFSGWRVPTAVAALLGYDAEREAGNAAGARNTIAARTAATPPSCFRCDTTRTGPPATQRASLVYPCRELAELRSLRRHDAER